MRNRTDPVRVLSVDNVELRGSCRPPPHLLSAQRSSTGLSERLTFRQVGDFSLGSEISSPPPNQAPLESPSALVPREP